MQKGDAFKLVLSARSPAGGDLTHSFDQAIPIPLFDFNGYMLVTSRSHIVEYLPFHGFFASLLPFFLTYTYL